MPLPRVWPPLTASIDEEVAERTEGNRCCRNNCCSTARTPRFSPEQSDLTPLRHRCAAGKKIPRKGGPGITRSDLLIINKTDLAPLVGASLEIMDTDARRMRGALPFVFTNLKAGTGLDTVIRFIIAEGMLPPGTLGASPARPLNNARMSL